MHHSVPWALIHTNNVVAFFTAFAVLFICGLMLTLLYLRSMVVNRALHVQERQARFTLFVLGLVLAEYAIMLFVLGLPWEPSLAIVALFGFTGLSGMIGRAERRDGKITLDERDREILLVANTTGFGAFWGLLVLTWTIWFLILGPNGKVTLEIGQLGYTIFAGMIIIFSVRAATTLLLYRRDMHAEAH